MLGFIQYTTMIEDVVEGAIGKSFALTALVTFCLVFVGSKLFKANEFSHIPRYEVSKGGKRSNQFPTLSRTLHEAFPKVAAMELFQVKGLIRK